LKMGVTYVYIVYFRSSSHSHLGCVYAS